MSAMSRKEIERALKSYAVDLLALAEELDACHVDVDVAIGKLGSYVSATAWDAESRRIADVTWDIMGGDGDSGR